MAIKIIKTGFKSNPNIADIVIFLSLMRINGQNLLGFFYLNVKVI